MALDDPFQQQVEVTITRGQHHLVDPAGGIDHIESAGCRATEVAVVMLEGGRIVERYQSLMNAGVPVPAFVAGLLDERLEAHVETEVAQDLLELLLLAVTAIDGIGGFFSDDDTFV